MSPRGTKPGLAAILRHRRWVFAGLVLALALAPVFALVHCAFEVHEYCATHGAVEHGAPHDHSAPRDSGDPRDPRDPHTPCEVLPALRAEISLPDLGGAPIVAVAYLTSPLGAPSRITPLPAVALLRIAPKTSPPCVAI